LNSVGSVTLVWAPFHSLAENCRSTRLLIGNLFILNGGAHIEILLSLEPRSSTGKAKGCLPRMDSKRNPWASCLIRRETIAKQCHTSIDLASCPCSSVLCRAVRYCIRISCGGGGIFYPCSNSRGSAGGHSRATAYSGTVPVFISLGASLRLELLW
jgi:hypothetical protein